MATPTPTLKKERIKAISIEYLMSEKEADPKAPLVVGQGLSDRFNFTEDLGYRTFFGVKRYITGLDPEVVRYDPEIDEELKETRIAEIEDNLQRLEKFFGKGTLDATNDKHWSQAKLVISRKTTNLDLTNPKNELIYHCIKAGGFSDLVAPNLEEAERQSKKFYLIEPTEFVENRVAPREVKNSAKAALQKLYHEKGQKELFHIAKFLLPAEKAYTTRTSPAAMYEDVDRYLDGEVVKKSQIACARDFLEAVRLPKADLVISNLVKDALHQYSFIYTNANGELKNNETGGVYGTTVENAMKHLQNPAYEHELENIKSRVEKKWSE